MSKMMITCGYDDKDDDLPAAKMKKMMINTNKWIKLKIYFKKVLF